VTPKLDPRTPFGFRAPVVVWRKFLSPDPPPLFHDFFAMLMRVPEFVLEGDSLLAMQNARALHRMMNIMRETGAPMAEADFEPIIGRYLGVDIDGARYRVHVEEAGLGVPLLCLHTAGADSRQYRHVVERPGDHRPFSRDRVRPAVSRPLDAAGWLVAEEISPHHADVSFDDPRGVAEARAGAARRDGCSMGGAIVLRVAANIR